MTGLPSFTYASPPEGWRRAPPKISRRVSVLRHRDRPDSQSPEGDRTCLKPHESWPEIKTDNYECAYSHGIPPLRLRVGGCGVRSQVYTMLCELATAAASNAAHTCVRLCV